MADWRWAISSGRGVLGCMLCELVCDVVLEGVAHPVQHACKCRHPLPEPQGPTSVHSICQSGLSARTMFVVCFMKMQTIPLQFLSLHVGHLVTNGGVVLSEGNGSINQL